MQQKQSHTDIIHQGWVGKMPGLIQPYLYLMRLDRPIGTWLLLLPGWWAILLTGGLGAWKAMILFALGAVIMRGAGCAVNDLWDRDLDKQVERTKTRPLANGDISIKQAITFVSVLLLLGLVILLQFNILTITIGCISILFIITYPLMKRITWWPQAFLGLTFNFGALMGWTAITGDLPWQAWALYASGFFWTLGYDTIYAMQDREDDMMIGIKSSARYLTERYKGHISIPLYIFYGSHFILLLFACANEVYAIGGLLVGLLPFLHLRWQIKTLDISAPENALNRFKSNRDYGLIICALIILFQSITISPYF